MIPNPIHKVLSTLSTHEVRYLLMGGQACVLYGAAEFSRDCDIAILCDQENLARLSAALRELRAETIAVPPFDAAYLERGHAVHFRCREPQAKDIRLDVMSRLRGVSPFDELWSRRTTLEDSSGVHIEVMSLPDLVAAKKTQRDKDWPMIRRLIESDFAAHKNMASDQQIAFWLRESRTPEILAELAAKFPSIAGSVAMQRPLVALANGDPAALDRAFYDEEFRERASDRLYWAPLKLELEQLRHSHRNSD